MRPIVDRLGIPPGMEELGAYEAARHYGWWVGQAHRFLGELAIPITPENHAHAMPLFGADLAMFSYFSRLGFSEFRLNQAWRRINSGYEADGVILGISASVFDSFTIETAEGGGSEGYRIYSPNGLDVRHLQGLEPLGDREWNALEELQ